MTSNLGVRDLSQAQTSLGFQAAAATEEEDTERRHKQMKTRIDDELKRMFRPEFLNRIDAVVTFKSLTTVQVRSIVDLMLARTMKHLSEQEVYLDVTDAAKDWLAKEGFDRIYGARPLRRVITTRIEDPLSEELLRGTFSKGDTILVDENGVTLIPKPRAKEPAGSGAESKDS
jgi:ATP-dependent Clp protease ATP-binding subunit ClpC